MKTKNLNFILTTAFMLILVACSTKKDNFATRNWQALNTKYNVLFNGNEAYEKGIVNLKLQHNDNFWEILPIERQIPIAEKSNDENAKKTVNPDFDLAETKGVKAVQKRSIYIDGTERNFQIDESYLLLGKARYFDNRFIPALEAFNYILYKYPTSSNILEAKIWREKTNIRLDNDEIAIRNLVALLKEFKEKNQIYADANAILAQAFIKIELKDSAVSRLKKALEFTKSKEEKARYNFILGQLNDDLKNQKEAFVHYQSVIDMKRKSPKQYVIQAHARQAGLLDVTKTDTIAFFKKFNDLLKDRENRPYLDVLHHQIALFYDKNNNIKQAKKQYKLSLKHKKTDEYLQASNYRNLATIYFYDAKYSLAGKYFDSTLVKLNPKTKEFVAIKKKRDNLDDVIKYEEIATRNDSILNILAMTDVEKSTYFEKLILKLKSDDEKEKIAESKGQIIKKEENFNKSEAIEIEPNAGTRKSKMPPSVGQKLNQNDNIASDFYFYNNNTVAFGKTEFKKKWGDRELKNNWRLISGNSSDKPSNDSKSEEKTEIDPRYTAEFYIKKLPKKQTEIDELIKDRNFAYYQLGVIYKEKFKEYYLAKDKLEALLTKNPEERLVLPSMYNLYKIYEIIDADKATAMKNEIMNRFPNSRYAQILGGGTGLNNPTLSADGAYNDLYKTYLSGDYRTGLKNLENAVNQFSGEEIISKMELLKANTIGKIKGLTEFKKALNYVALTYPNTEEGKKAEKFLAKEIVAMEALQFNLVKPTSWKVIYKIGVNDLNTNDLIKKVTLFSDDRSPNKPIFSIDLYTMEENFVVLHGWKTEEEAKGIATILAEYKDYKVVEKPIIINNDSYKIVQIKKNLSEYLIDPKKVAVPVSNNPHSTPEPINSNPIPNQKQLPRLPGGKNPNAIIDQVKSDSVTQDPVSLGAPPEPVDMNEVK